MILERGIIHAYDATAHTAAVQLFGSLSRIILGLPVAHHIGPELLTTGAACLVGFVAEGSQGVILATFDGAPDPWITPALITFSPCTPEGAFYSSGDDQTLTDDYVTYQNLSHEITVTEGQTIRYLCVASVEFECAAYTNWNNRLLRIYEDSNGKGNALGDQSRAVNDRHSVTNSYMDTITATKTISAKIVRGAERNTELCRRGTMSLIWWEDT